MRTALLLALLAPACVPLYGREKRLDFEHEPAPKPSSGAWSVVEVPDAPSPTHVLVQTAAGESAQYNLTLCESTAPLNADVRVALRAVAGEIDQGGGLVWRARDERNYYLARWNPLESNLRAYKIVDGVRTQLASAKVELGPGWHVLRVWFRREGVEVFLDGESRLEFEDATFAVPGMVGLWTKADAVTQFDDLEIQEL